VAFTVGDFHDLIELLAQHPEWRAELRRYVLSDDLIELPVLVRQLVETQARAEARLEGVEARLERLEATVQALAEAQTRAEARLEGVEARLERVEARLEGVESRLGRIDVSLGRLDDRVGHLDGKMFELTFSRRGPGQLSSMARRLRIIESGPLADLLDDAIDEGQLTTEERETIMLADVVLAGRRSDGQDVYLLAELSVGVGVHDVERAVERAALLEKLGRPVMPVVAGDRITPEAAVLARDRGVWYAQGGRVTAPRT
jgi:hypothetical protein